MNSEKIESRLDQIAQDIKADYKEMNSKIIELEIEQEKAYERFNTKTHVLVQREFLENMQNSLDSIKTDSGYAADEADEASNYACNVRGYSEDAANTADTLYDDIATILHIEDSE